MTPPLTTGGSRVRDIDDNDNEEGAELAMTTTTMTMTTTTTRGSRVSDDYNKDE